MVVMAANEYWLISLPGEKNPTKAFEDLNNLTSKQYNLSQNCKFNIPSHDIKVGTLDVLIGLTDDLAKLDGYAESLHRKTVGYLLEVTKDVNKFKENLLVNGVGIHQYLTRFQWDTSKHPIKQSLRNIYDALAQRLSGIEEDLKERAQSYNNVKSSLQALERKSTGSLLTRNLGDLVSKRHFVLGSEYLTTLLVVVPKALYNDWKQKYEKLTDMVVPQSSELIKEDNECGLFSVTLFQRVADEFKHHCRENKFIVRDFVYDETTIEHSKQELSRLQDDQKKQHAPWLRWLKINVGETFMLWMHVKALRVFVESVLRYGLPVDFQPILLRPNKRSLKKLRDVLNQRYAHLDNSGSSVAEQTPIDVPGLNLNQHEYYPYVFFRVDLGYMEGH